MNEKQTEKIKKVIKKVKPEKPDDALINKLQKENKELTEKVLRLNAEMQNMNRRFAEEKADIYKYDGEKLIKQLLPIIDNFERALNVDEASQTEDVSKFLSGVKMIYTQILNTLKGMGVEEIDAYGKEFDPECMEAIMTVKVMEEESNVVVEVLQKGYRYNGKVVRVAMVKVNE